MKDLMKKLKIILRLMIWLYFLVIFIELQKNIEKLQRLINMKSNQIINLICGIIVINF